MLNFPIIQHKKYLKWVYVVNMILYLRGCIIYDLNEIINGLHKNFNTLLKYPLTYTNVILRIAFVKLFENIFKRKFKFRF